jgi:hypothetical protein
MFLFHRAQERSSCIRISGSPPPFPPCLEAAQALRKHSGECAEQGTADLAAPTAETHCYSFGGWNAKTRCQQAVLVLRGTDVFQALLLCLHIFLSTGVCPGFLFL